MPYETLRVHRRPDVGGLRSRVYDPLYYDFLTTHPEFQGTELLMRTYEALEARGIPFRYSMPIGDSLATAGLRESITAHFYIPEINTVIIMQGGYWFEDASRLQDTALMIALLEYAGYNVLWWNEPDLLARGLDRIIEDEPILRNITMRGSPYPATDYTPIPYRQFYREPPRPMRRAIAEGGRRRGRTRRNPEQ